MDIPAIAVTASINNCPDNFGKDYRMDYKRKYLVVRRDEHDASLWYYGTYDNKERAQEVALEIRNGIVLRVM